MVKQIEALFKNKNVTLANSYFRICSDPVDIETLRNAAATKGGLLTDEVRRKVWPKLLNINVYELPHKPG